MSRNNLSNKFSTASGEHNVVIQDNKAQEQVPLARSQSNVSSSNTDQMKKPIIGFGIIAGVQNTVLAMVKAAKDKAKKDMLPLCVSRIVLGKYGPGYPLYFEYILVCGIILVLMFGIVSINNLIWYHDGGVCALFKSGEYSCPGGTAILYSLGNRGGDDSFWIPSILNLTFTLIALVLAFFYRKIQARTANEVDDNSVTAADYTIIVENLPQDEKPEDIKKFFSEYRKDGTLVNVVEVNLAYQIGEYVDLIRKKHALIQRKEKGPISVRNERKLAWYENHIEAIRRSASPETKINFTGIAFVTFNTQKEATEAINYFAMGAIQGALYSIFSKFADCIGKQSNKLYKGKVIHVSRSHEPADIYWENLGLPLKIVFKLKMINFICSCILIVICFGLILGINYAQSYAKDHTKVKAAVTVLSLLCSVFIVVINACLGAFVRKLAKFEKPETDTSYQVNVAESLSVAQFINTAFVTLLVEFVQEQRIRLWTADGIVTGFFYVFILNAFTTSILKIVDVMYFYKLFKRNKIIKGSTTKMTQKEVDDLFEDPPFDVAQQYANIQKTMLFTAFYASVIPLGVLFSIVGLAVTYWADKYVLLRRTRKPADLGKELAEEMADYLELIVSAFCAGNLVFQKIAGDSFSVLNIIAMGIAGFVLILPNGTLLSCIFPDKEDNEDTELHYAAAVASQGFSGYSEVNPVALEDNAVAVNDIEKNHEKQVRQADKIYNNGINLDALEEYAINNLTFLQSNKLKEQGFKQPLATPNKATDPVKKTETIHSRMANAALFNTAALAAVNDNKEDKSGFFASLFKGTPKTTKTQNVSYSEAAPMVVNDLQITNRVSSNSPDKSSNPSSPLKPKPVEGQPLRISTNSRAPVRSGSRQFA